MIRSLIDIINSTYLLLMELAAYFAVFDTPGVYIMIMVVDIVFASFFYKSVYSRYANPQKYSDESIFRRAIIGTVILALVFLIGYVNLLKFI